MHAANPRLCCSNVPCACGKCKQCHSLKIRASQVSSLLSLVTLSSMNKQRCPINVSPHLYALIFFYRNSLSLSLSSHISSLSNIFSFTIIRACLLSLPSFLSALTDRALDPRRQATLDRKLKWRVYPGMRHPLSWSSSGTASPSISKLFFKPTTRLSAPWNGAETIPGCSRPMMPESSNTGRAIWIISRPFKVWLAHCPLTP